MKMSCQKKNDAMLGIFFINNLLFIYHLHIYKKLKIPKGQKWYNGIYFRSHKTLFLYNFLFTSYTSQKIPWKGFRHWLKIFYWALNPQWNGFVLFYSKQNSQFFLLINQTHPKQKVRQTVKLSFPDCNLYM